MNSVFIKPILDDGGTGWTRFDITPAIDAAKEAASAMNALVSSFEYTFNAVFRGKRRKKTFIRSISNVNYQHYQRRNGYKRIPRKIKKRIMKGEIV